MPLPQLHCCLCTPPKASFSRSTMVQQRSSLPSVKPTSNRSQALGLDVVGERRVSTRCFSNPRHRALPIVGQRFTHRVKVFLFLRVPLSSPPAPSTVKPHRSWIWFASGAIGKWWRLTR
jgi:hypothetical protein